MELAAQVASAALAELAARAALGAQVVLLDWPAQAPLVVPAAPAWGAARTARTAQQVHQAQRGNPGATGSSGNNGVTGGTGATGSSGAGGVGVTGANLAIINSGTISGGLSGDGLTRAAAIVFTGGSNSLTLAAGYTIIGNVVGTGTDTFQLGGSGTGSFNLGSIGSVQQYRGFSTFNVVGGTWTASGTYGQNNAWTLSGGTLNVTGDLSAATSLTVSGGMLMGTGTVGNTQINSGGTFAPGSGTPGASMTVNGNLAFASGATYLIEVNRSTASFGTVTGTATLGGATVNAVYASGSYISRQYTILTAGSVTGMFGSLVNTNLPANFHTTLSYDAKDAYLNLALNFTPSSFGPNFGSSLNVNQQNVANTLTNFFNTTGGIPMVFGTLTPGGLTQVSGEVATGSQQSTFDAMTQFMGLMTDPFIDGRGGNAAPPSGAASGYAATQSAGAARDAYAMFNEAPVTTFDAALERVGGGLRRFADHRRQCDGGIEYDDLEHLWHRGRRRLSHFAVYGCRFCAGRRRHELLGRG